MRFRLGRRRPAAPPHDCGTFLFESGPPWNQLREQFRCECGTWFRPGEVELWPLLVMPRAAIHPHADGGRWHYWYRVKPAKT